MMMMMMTQSAFCFGFKGEFESINVMSHDMISAFKIEIFNIEYICFQSHLFEPNMSLPLAHLNGMDHPLSPVGRDDWLQIMAVLWRSARSRSRCRRLVMLRITHELLN